METRPHLDDADIERLFDDAVLRGAGRRLAGRFNRRYRRRLWLGSMAGGLMVMLLSATLVSHTIPTRHTNYRLEGYTLQEAMDQNYYMLTNK